MIKFAVGEYLAVRACVNNIGIVKDIFPEVGIAGCGIFVNIIVCLP